MNHSCPVRDSEFPSFASVVDQAYGHTNEKKKEKNEVWVRERDKSNRVIATTKACFPISSLRVCLCKHKPRFVWFISCLTNMSNSGKRWHPYEEAGLPTVAANYHHPTTYRDACGTARWEMFVCVFQAIVCSWMTNWCKLIPFLPTAVVTKKQKPHTL